MLAQAERAVSPRRLAKSSTKRSRSKGNSLPPTKWFDFTMVDNNFEESQLGFAPKEMNADTKKCVKFFKDSASARNHYSSSTLKMVPNNILLTDTALKLLEVVIHHGVIKPLGRWKAAAFAMRTLGRLGHSTSTQGYVPTASLQPTTGAFNDSNYPRIFRAPILVNHLLHTFSGYCVLYCRRPSGAKHPRVSCSKRNTPLKACSDYYLH